MGRNKRRRAHQRETKEDELKHKQCDEKCTNQKKAIEGKQEVSTIVSTNGLEQKKVIRTPSESNDILSSENVHRALSEIAGDVDALSLKSNSPNDMCSSRCDSPDNRDYFLHYVCHICKIVLENCENITCSKCKLVRYCSTKHQREHWPSHSDVCEALGKNMNGMHLKNISPENFRTLRVNLIRKCELLIARSLEKWERELILYYNRCHVCYERDISLLESCKTCKYTSFCKAHPVNENHSKYCSSLVLYRNIVLQILTKELVSIYFPENFSETFKKIDMNSFCSEETDGELESVYLSELATAPLSVLWTLKTVFKTYQSIPQCLSIHVIGAENDFELNVLEKWEILLAHYLPCKEINLVFIGPELFFDKKSQYVSCEECEDDKRKLLMTFHSHILYHEYVVSNRFIKPDLICSFNPGFYRSTGFNTTDTWEETISQMLKQNVPVLTTAYTKEEIIKDVERIGKHSKLEFLQTPSLNPFSSLKPSLSFVYDEVTPVIFKNYYYTIFKPC